jgi:hypothetical protein
MAKIIDQAPNAPAQVSVEKVASDGSCSNETALAIVLKDIRNDEDYVAQKMWSLRWREIDALYQSPRPISTWEGTNTTEANVQSFLVAKHTNSIVPAVMNGIFFQSPFFLLKTTAGTTEEVIRQKTTIFSAMFREMEFEEACWDGWFYTVLFGTAIYKWGTKVYQKEHPQYRRRGDTAKVPIGGWLGFDQNIETVDYSEIGVKDNVQDYWCPYLEHIPNEEVLVDCTLTKPDIRKARHVSHILYMTGYELIELCKEHQIENAKGEVTGMEEGWFMPTEAEIRSWFEEPKEPVEAPSAPLANMGSGAILTHAREEQVVQKGDPLENVLRVIEHTTSKRITMVVQDKMVVRNSKNQWGRINYLSSHWWKIPRSFWSMGIGHLAGQEQRVDQGTRNAALNLLSMAVNPPMLRASTQNQPGQNIRLRRGAVITVEGDDVRKGFGIMEMPKIPAELWPVLQNANQSAEEATGADQRLSQGNTGGAGTSMGRTASGAIQLASAQSNRLQGPISRFVKTVLEPYIYLLDELINEEMPEKQMKEILGDEMGADYKKTWDLAKYLNGRTKFEILAAQHIAAKKGMAQFLPLLSQIFENQQLLGQLNKTGWTIDAVELVSMFMEVSEWSNRNDLIRKMTPQEIQFQMGMAQVEKGQAAKVHGQMAIDKNRGQIQSDINSEANDARATQIVLRRAMESALQPEMLTGEAGGLFANEEATGQ